ncbi:MAG: DNA-formamidopyrimidine glycosylase family protein, partial [Candidatus Saccharimonas sp.]
MPELPEVETVRRGLAELLPGRVVARTAVFDSPKSFPNAPADVEQFLYGARVTAVRRRAKVLMIDLDTQYSLVVHLKMTGQLVFRSCHPAMYRRKKSGRACHRDPDCFPMILEDDKVPNFAGGHPNDSLIGELPDRSTRVQMDFTDGSRLFFNDQRKFGWMKLLPTVEVQNLPFI